MTVNNTPLSLTHRLLLGLIPQSKRTAIFEQRGTIPFLSWLVSGYRVATSTNVSP